MSLCGNGMYGLMNRNTMKLYLDNQRAKFSAPDYIENIFKNSTINRCTSYDAICMDVYNRFKLFEQYDDTYFYGVKTNTNRLYLEDFSLLAPLYINNNIPLIKNLFLAYY